MMVEWEENELSYVKNIYVSEILISNTTNLSVQIPPSRHKEQL